jgi:ATP-dependent RNA helicase RhlE
MSFESLGLMPELVRAVADEGYTEPTPVQREAIPLVLAGRDLVAGAQTGTGKTAAFVLPLLQRLHTLEPRSGGRTDRGGTPVRASGRPVRALIVTPTRELALQVEASLRTYGKHRPLRSVAIYGGVGFEPQVRALRAGASVVVATPGRLLDHVRQRTIDLAAVEVLVLDEADRMLDMGFVHDIRRILALLPADRQSLLFSATFSVQVRALAHGLLRDPATVQVSPVNTSAESVDHRVIPVDRDRKRDLLSRLVHSGRIDQALVFTRTKRGANKLAEQLQHDGIRVAAIHGNKSQGQRTRALTDFKAGRVDILVATDIAARGIDIDALPHVVNYELPMVAADYVHRIGRTGRAGASGQATSLVSVEEAGELRDVERFLGWTLPAEVVAGFEPRDQVRPQPGGPRPVPRGQAPVKLRSTTGQAGRRRAAPVTTVHQATRPGSTPSRSAHRVPMALPGERLSGAMTAGLGRTTRGTGGTT